MIPRKTPDDTPASSLRDPVRTEGETFPALAPRERLLAVGILAGALVARLAFALFLPPKLYWPDAIAVVKVGRHLAEAGNFAGWTDRGPVYPALIALVDRLFGPDLRVLRIVEALLATCGVALLGMTALRRFGRRVALVTLVLTAFHPLLAFMPSSGYSESTAFVVMTVLLWAADSAVERGGLARWVLVGALVGLETLIRPNAVTFLPGFLFGSFLLFRRERRAWLVPIVATSLATVVVVVPWIVRCHQVHHEWFFVSTGGGRALWLGNNENATANTSELPVIDERTRATLRRLALPAPQDRWYRAEAFRFIREHPGRAAVLYVRKLGNLFALYPDPATRSFVGLASKLSQGLVSALVFAGVLVALARVRSRPALWPMLLGSLTFVIPTALAYTNVRYRLFFEPCLLIAAGVGWASVLAPAAGRLRVDSRPSTVAGAR